MGNFHDHIPDNLMNWIQKQEMFFVATAPLSDSGHVNVSPKGLAGTFHIASPTRVWYQDLSGSGTLLAILALTSTRLKTLTLRPSHHRRGDDLSHP